MGLTQEDKKLLLADLCARLPYGVKISAPDGNQTLVGNICTNGGGKVYTTNMLYNISQVKPYLRPMLSMTEEEREELRQEQIKDEQLFADCIKNHPEMRGLIIPHFAADWCDKNMFDYRGLIERGLALEAPDGMYNNKEERQ